MSDRERRLRVLFICTGNACRSPMAEAILRHVAGGRFEAFSAGSNPAGFVSALAIEALHRLGISAEGLRSKSWHEFADAELDIVITLCDNAASMPCPVWPGAPVQVHWPLPDPTFHDGTPDERLQVAVAVAETLRRRLLAVVNLPLDRMSAADLRKCLEAQATT